MGLINGQSDTGSSLRVRGTAERLDDLLVQPRVIPACAGNGARFNHFGRGVSGHPCVCGERTVLSRLAYSATSKHRALTNKQNSCMYSGRAKTDTKARAEPMPVQIQR